MMRNANWLGRLCLLALPGVLAVSCAGGIGDEPQVCTLIGGETGVTVSWNPGDFAELAKDGTASLVARLCAQGVCESSTSKNGDASPMQMKVELGEDFNKPTVSVQFTVTAQGDGKRVLFDEREQVEMRKLVPNGEGCPPTLFRGGLSADPERGLIPERS
ncbi:hypothetical protein P8605_30165 [Streptomyces sp. T-3]|nr:hypothetical protein [Streptomyces sp. T-3]